MAGLVPERGRRAQTALVFSPIIGYQAFCVRGIKSRGARRKRGTSDLAIGGTEERVGPQVRRKI